MNNKNNTNQKRDSKNDLHAVNTSLNQSKQLNPDSSRNHKIQNGTEKQTQINYSKAD